MSKADKLLKTLDRSALKRMAGRRAARVLDTLDGSQSADQFNKILDKAALGLTGKKRRGGR